MSWRPHFPSMVVGFIAGTFVFLLYNALNPINAEQQAITCALAGLAGALLGWVYGLWLRYTRLKAEQLFKLNRLKESGRPR